MKYSSFPCGPKVSRLGFGCMRLPVAGEDKHINEVLAISMIRGAIDRGVTYIDTAWPYHGGKSEIVVGKALKDGYREKLVLATKLPIWSEDIQTKEDMHRVLDEQLAKLQTDHVDFYLMHALNKERFEKMKRLDYKSFFAEAMASGKILHPAFSFHDDAETFRAIVDDYPWHMAQVQMNILDENYQATVAGMEYAASKGIGLVVMEPLRGGAMAKAPAEVQKLYDNFPVQRKAVDWAFRYLYDMPFVMTILSGMSVPEQVEDNLRIFEDAEANCMDDAEKQLIRDVRAAYLSRIKTGCTGCKYCQPCPAGVKIPNVFRNYDNALMFDRQESFRATYEKLEAEQSGPSQCAMCGNCEASCPQHLEIIRMLAEIRQEMEK